MPPNYEIHTPDPINSLLTLAENWDNFEHMDISQHAPPAQLTEMHKAFYSGAASAALIIARETTETGMLKALAKIHVELVAYCNAPRAIPHHD